MMNNNLTDAYAQGFVEVNAHPDLSEFRKRMKGFKQQAKWNNAQVSDQVLGIDIGDVCFTNDTTTSSNRRALEKTDGGPTIYSSANGAMATTIASARYAGVAFTKYDYTSSRDPDSIARTGVSLQIGGVANVRNTGDGAIKAFDFVEWYVPPAGDYKNTHMDGIDKNKIMFKLRTYEVGKADSDPQRIIGHALRGAGKGAPFSIKIGSYMG
jgi:hypothetical protein